MLTARNIHKLVQNPKPQALLEALTANGTHLPLVLRVRLMESPASTIALALKRVVELSYMPNPHHMALLRQLLDAQAHDGSFGHDPIATALAVAALHASQNASITSADPEAGLAFERGLNALAALQEDDGFFNHSSDRCIQSRALTAAFVLATLTGVEEFRSAVRYGDVLAAFDNHDDRLDNDTLSLLQQALAPVAQTAAVPVPARAA
jgi:hypothetical protein